MLYLGLSLLLACSPVLSIPQHLEAAYQEIEDAKMRVSTPRLSPVPTTSLPAPLQAYLKELHASMLTATPRYLGGSAVTAQDCSAYSLAYERALQLIPSRAPNIDVWNALRLGPECGAAPPPDAASLGIDAPWPPKEPLASTDGPTFFVSPTGDDSASGTEAAPFATIARGVAATRTARAPGAGPASVVLRAGVHVLGNTINLGFQDQQLTIAAYPGEAAWVSGGAPVGPLSWSPVNVSASTGANVWSAHVPNPPVFMTGLNTLASDGSPSKRLFRAQFPNFNPEMHATAACGGGSKAAATPECVALAAASPFLQHLGARIASAGGSAFEAAGGPMGVADPSVLQWVKPANFTRPEVYARDLLALGLKNNSAMDNYNRYSTGRGGPCGLWTNAWGPETSYGWDYHCGLYTDGGWEEVDELMQTLGQLNMPVGLMFDRQGLPNMANWSLNLDPAHRVNGAAIVNVWMTQGWFNNMFYVTGQHSVNASAGVLDMVADDGHYPSGGWQGGRHWQTRCSFKGCGPGGDLLGGGWFVSNVEQELDSPDEYFFDPATNTLTVFWNATTSPSGPPPFSPPPSTLVLMAPQLEVFFNLSGGADDITLHGLGFRDQRFSYMEPWVVPSGGDWGLRPYGAVTFVDSARSTLSSALFSRTDGNAVFTGGRCRNVSILDSEFVWLGMSAVASLGMTDQEDATGGEQPFGTLLSGLVVREIALYEKQSSAFFLGRTPLARLEASIFYNMPRAAVNVNDVTGGGNNLTTTLTFNTCRLPFLSLLTSSPESPSFYPALSEATGNFNIANYGAAQGYDNDDGSSFNFIHDNFFYQADGFKMDYGGSDSIFASNVIVVRPYDGQNCFNMWAFVAGHQDILYNNTCAIWQPGVTGNPKDADMILTQNDCHQCDTGDRSAVPVLHDNHYYTTHGNASVNCGGDWGTTVADMQKAFPDWDERSTWHTLPDAATVIQWGRDVLRM